jgi:sodium-dependent dicarboxylate transporter 2/3/5
MLGIAFAASIGGMGTLIGTPPNALFASLLQSSYGITVGFAQWMLIGVPVVAILVPLTWLVLTRVVLRVPGAPGAPGAPDAGAGPPAAAALTALPPMSRGERAVALVLAATALAWIFRPALSSALPTAALSDAGIAITAALLLFALPAHGPRGGRLLDWRDARDIRWDVLILFGGGLALAGAMHGTGLAQWIGGAVSALGDLPRPLLLLVLVAVIVVLGEVASNTAIAAVFLPIAGAAAIGMGAGPASLMLPVALACSLGFMLPVATPPNAIAYGTGLVDPRQMLRAGAVLDLIGIAVAVVVAAILGPRVFG